MSIILQENPADHIPQDFTLESLQQSLNEDEIAALMAGDDPIIAAATAEPVEEAPVVETPTAAVTPPVETPKVEIPDTREAEALIAKLDDDLADLATKYDAGEMTQAEWLAQQKTIVQQQAQAQVVIQRAQTIVSDVVAQRRQSFYDNLNSYKAAGNEFLWSQDHLQGWDAALKAVTGNNAYSNLPFDRQIALAHEMYAANVKAVTGKPLQGPKVAAAPVEPKETEPTGPRTDPRPEPVQTLGGLNTDSAASMDDGTFATIDKTMAKDPMAAEAMLDRLPGPLKAAYLERA